MSSMTTTDNKAFLMNLPVWSVIHTCSPIPQKRPAIARASVLVRATRWLSFSLAHYWNCGGC